MQHLFHVNDELHKLSYKNTCDIPNHTPIQLLLQSKSSKKYHAINESKLLEPNIHLRMEKDL